MNEQIKIQQLLQRKLTEYQAGNRSYSVRALARKLGMGPGPTAEILQGKRRVSRQIAEKIVDRLQLDPSERTELLRDYPVKLRRNTSASRARAQDLEVLKLNADQFEIISEWTHFAILSLMRLKTFKSDVAWIAQRLGVPGEQARKALLRLQHLGLVQVDRDGVMTRTPQPVRTSDDVLDLSLQRMHQNDMEMAKVKLKELRVDQRDFTNYTFPANPAVLKRAKEIIRKAQDDLEELMADDEASEVFRVCMYLFPLTQAEAKT
jgi:uncharacterized protein (TIGR02147 family)